MKSEKSIMALRELTRSFLIEMEGAMSNIDSVKPLSSINPVLHEASQETWEVLDDFCVTLFGMKACDLVNEQYEKEELNEVSNL